MKISDILNLAGVLAILVIVFTFGYRLYPKLHKCSQIASDTIISYDTVFIALPPDTLLLPSDTLYIPPDTIIITAKVDTAAIMKDYYTKYSYPWVRRDTNIIITGVTEVYKNRMTLNYLQYLWLQPQTIIKSSVENVTNKHYISIGFDIPVLNITYTEIEAFYHFRSGYFGIGYTPELRSFNIKQGFNIINF